MPGFTASMSTGSKGAERPRFVGVNFAVHVEVALVVADLAFARVADHGDRSGVNNIGTGDIGMALLVGLHLVGCRRPGSGWRC